MDFIDAKLESIDVGYEITNDILVDDITEEAIEMFNSNWFVAGQGRNTCIRCESNNKTFQPGCIPSAGVSDIAAELQQMCDNHNDSLQELSELNSELAPLGIIVRR